jgi:hypothetical protein
LGGSGHLMVSLADGCGWGGWMATNNCEVVGYA